MSKNVRRLVSQFRPDSYELLLAPESKTMAFTGTVTIRGRKTGRPSQRLVLHQKDLKIIKATITHKDKRGSRSIPIQRINTHKNFDELRLHTKDMLYPGEYEINIEFSGSITRPMQGIYPCYFKRDGKEQIIIATQFESHHAREAFPCIDEPEAKATFDLTLVTKKHEAVIANTPVSKQSTNGKTLKTQFETTPKMSTYLLAFVFGNLQHLESKTKHGVVVRAYATPDNVKHTKFALDCAVKVLDFYNEYFDIPYPLAKCDMVALPDFAAGAMENWGCVTFREQALLVDPKNTSLPMKQYVVMVVAHELAHQWFGNLVTMRWWTDLWLNEGFASWIEYLATDRLFPEWHMWTQFIVDEQEVGLRLDALENTHPIEVPIHHPDEIRTIFDSISYQKGSSVIHMLHEHLGAEDFRDGLRYYLKKHAYNNTDTVDLWAALEKSSHKPVKSFMHAWTSQPGFPIVRAIFLPGNKVKVSQERFYLNPEAKKESHLWPIPLHAGNSLMQDAKKSLDEVPQTFRLNTKHSGFYRTIYNEEHLEKLGNQIKKNELGELDRLGLLSDSVEAAKAGYMPTVDALYLLDSYADETSSVVWDIIAGLFSSVRMVMNDESLRESMKPFGRHIVAKQLKRLGWNAKKNEPYFDSLLRPTILGLAAVADEPTVVKEALSRFHEAKKSEAIAPDLRGVIYGTVARKGSKQEFDTMLRWHNASSNSEERIMFAAALTSFKQTSLIKQALGLINSDEVRLQDAGYWVAYSFMNRFARDATWDWMTKNWKWLEQNLGTDLSFYRFPIYAARAHSNATFLPTFKKFFSKHMNPAFERPVKQGIETIEWQSDWRERDLESIKKFFKAASKFKT